MVSSAGVAADVNSNNSLQTALTGLLPNDTYDDVHIDGLAFQTSTLLTNGQTYDSGVLDARGYTQVQTHVLSDKTGTITIDFVRDSGGTDVLRTLTIPYGAADLNVYQMFSAPAFTPYIRYRFQVTQADQADFYFDTKFLTKALSPQILGVNAFVSPLMVATLQRSVIAGQTAGGTFANVGITNQRALQVTPPEEGRTAFGETLVGDIIDQQLANFSFGNITDSVSSTANGAEATVTNSNGLGVVSTGAGANNMARLRTTGRVRYVPGHGNRGRFTAVFTTGAANSTQAAGFGDESNGFFFGYNGTAFGILHRNNGSPEIRTLTISAGANDGTGTDDITITLDGNATTVTLTDFSGSTTLTANTIAAADYSQNGTGWSAKAYGNTVVFTSYDAAAHTGTYSLVDTDSTGAAGTFAQTVAGAVATDTWVPQASWNGDEIFDGTGITGTTIDPTKLNVYQIVYQYLGAGNIFFFLEDGIDGQFHLVHTIRYANANTAPSISNPHLPLEIEVKNTSNTSDIVVKSGSMSGGTDGVIQLVGPRRALSANSGSINAATETPIIVIKNSPVFGGKANTNKIKVINIGASAIVTSGNSSATVKLIKNAAITAASYTAVDASNSIVEYDTAATASTGGTIIASAEVLAGTSISFDSEDYNDLVLEAGDTLTVATVASSNNTTVYATIRLIELF
jgi:hypothetical protein